LAGLEKRLARSHPNVLARAFGGGSGSTVTWRK
jgi:hypothetical protein